MQEIIDQYKAQQKHKRWRKWLMGTTGYQRITLASIAMVYKNGVAMNAFIEKCKT